MGAPYAIRLVADRNKIKADPSDLSFIKIEVVDKLGQLVPQDSLKIRLTISGNGGLAASGNANPKDMASVNRPVMDTYKGKALAVIRPSGKEGVINVKAESQGLKMGELTIQAMK